MNDDEIRAMAAAVKSLLDARDLTMRAELADMRSTCEALQSEVQGLRAKVAVLPGETHAAAARMVQTLGASLAKELPGAIAVAAERHLSRMVTRSAEPEQRAAPSTEAAA